MPTSQARSALIADLLRSCPARATPPVGPTQRLSLTFFTGGGSPGVFPRVGSPRLKRRSPQPGPEGRRVTRRSPEPRTAQHHDNRTVACVLPRRRVSPSFSPRPRGGGRFEVRESQHRNPEIEVLRRARRFLAIAVAAPPFFLPRRSRQD